MSDQNVRRALEQRLAAMSPAIPTAWENVHFTPTVGTPWQRANLLPASPDNTMLGPREWMEIGIFQVTLYYPAGTGSDAAQTRAEAVRAQFKRGTTVSHGGLATVITHTPAKAAAYSADGWYVVPISIRYQACIAT